jgi:hypothetical protein
MNRDIQNLSADIKIASSTQFNRYEYGYLGEINAMRGLSNSDFIMFLLPPSSTMADVYKNNEEASCVFHCYTKEEFGSPTNATESLQKIHDELKERFIQTLSNLTKNNEHKYIISSGINFDRTSREFNQDYVGLICNVSISFFSTCMPFSTQSGL